MNKKTINILDTIDVGDLLHYCPADLKEEAHDIGIIYNITPIKNSDQEIVKKYFIFWSKSKMYDEFSSNTLKRKLTSLRKGKYMMKVIKHGDSKTTL